MANDIVNLGFSVDTRQVKKGYQEFDKMEKSADKAEKSIGKAANTTSKGFAMAKRNIAAAAAALTAYVTAGKLIEVAREFDVLNASLVTATKGTENAAKAFTAIEKFASTTPYNLAQSVDGFVKLVNLGLTPSEKALQSYGNTAAALGKDLSQMVEAVADATTGEFERLKEFGITAKSQGDQVSLTFQGVTKTIGKNAAEIEGYLIAIGENEFAGAMAERAKTLDGAISNLGDSWDGLYRSIAGSGVSSIISDSIRSITEVIDTVSAYIASGALQAYANAFYEQWKWAFDGISAIAGFVGDIFTAVADKILDAYEFAFGKLPAYAKNAVQRIIIEISAIVDYARIYGEAFVTMISLKFSEAADRAKVYGKDIANALNPFSEDFNADAELADLDAKYARFYSNVMGYAAERAASLKSEKEASIEIINAERDATLESFDDQLEKANELYEAFKRNRDASSGGDALAGFKLPTKTDLSGTNDEFDKWIASIRTTTTETERLNKEIQKTQDAISSGKLRSDVGAEYIADLRAQLAELDTNPFQSMTEGANDALQAMSGMFESGSKDAKKLAIAMQALNLVQAVGAVLNQGTGDPYTAFGRMAAMAAMVASLGMSIGNLNGGIEDKSAEIQANQGLNQWGEQADGISTATEETAAATKKLVGINTDMLSALENLSMALSSASGLIASGVSFPSLSIDKFDFANLDLINKVIPELVGGMDIFASITQAIPNFISGTIGKLFGGSSDLTNQGILIIGGRISDLINDTVIKAFTEVTTSGGWFRRGGVYRNYTELSDEIGQQISLVFGGIAESVSAGAEILGLSQEQINNAINSFNVASQEISLKGMDIDEQQKAIEAYFSNVFNDLAGAIVPFLSKFTQAGEELSETLSRLATEVSVAEYLIDNFGVTFVDKISNPEAFAKAADNLAMLAGGVESLADQVSSFTDAFASDSTKLDIYQKAVTSALASVGLALPSTADGMWDLMSSLDATTEAGQRQIAALLGITDTADAYYSLVEKAKEKADAAALEAENAANEQARLMESVSDSITSALESILGKSESFAKTTYDTAKKYLGATLASGEINVSDAFYDALNGIASATEDMFGSAAEFSYENAVSANILKGLSDLTDGQLSVEEQQLQYLEIIANNTYSNDASLMLEGTKTAYYDNSTLVSEVVSMKNQMVSLMQQMNLKTDKIESNVSRIRLNSDDQLQIAAGGL